MSASLLRTIVRISFSFLLICSAKEALAVLVEGAEFLPEFTLIRRESYPEESLGDISNHKSDDQVSK